MARIKKLLTAIDKSSKIYREGSIADYRQAQEQKVSTKVGIYQYTLDDYIKQPDNSLADMRKLYVLELFSGLECISNAFRKYGHNCFTIDWDMRFQSSLHADISKLTIEDLPKEFRSPDVVFLGTDCTTYSVSAISKHRRKNFATGNLDPISDKARFADDMNRHCKELLKILNPKIQIWENPIGALRKMDFMQDLICNTTTYCQYGFTYRKGTDFFSNINLHLKPPCKNGSPCHEKAPRGARTGLQGIKDPALKAIYPPLLCEHIVKECEKHIYKVERREQINDLKHDC